MRLRFLLNPALSVFLGLACAWHGQAADEATGKPAAEKRTPKKAPAATEKALRARAAEFLQYQSEGSFTKAFELVAPDSKDYYLSLSKENLGGAKIESLQFSDKFKKAIVSSSVVRHANMGPAGIRDIPSARTDAWKQVGGKWMWYHDPGQDCVITLFGSLPCPTTAKGPDAKPAVASATPAVIPKDTRPEAVAAAAKTLLPGLNVDRNSLQFLKDTPATEEIRYHNAMRGQVRVMVDFVGGQTGLTLENNDKWLNADEDFIIRLSYVPNPNSPPLARMRIMLDPFGSEMIIPVRIVTRDEAAKLASEELNSAKP